MSSQTANYLNGYGSPKFRLVYKVPAHETVYTLPACNSDGEPETSTNEGAIYHKTLKGLLVPVNLMGSEEVFRIKWTLKYNKFIKGTDLLNLMEVLQHNSRLGIHSTNRIYLTPYNDVKYREYDVIMTSEDFSIDIKKGGANANGMWISDIEFTTRQLYSLNWIRPDTTPEATYGGEPEEVLGGNLQ